METSSRRGRATISVIAALLCIAALPGPALTQERPTQAEPASEVARSASAYPSFERTREITTAAFGVGMMGAGFLISIDVQQVPREGLDPSTINLSVDRNIVGNRSMSALTASDWTRNAALLMPWALAALTGPNGDRWHAMRPRVGVWAETFFVSMGATTLGKAVTSRPRPFAYLPSDQRPDDDYYDSSRERAFVSMPSGHASSAWTATGLAMTEHLLYRPDAHWFERVSIGFLGGALAASTSTFRVEAGQHFPTDVLAGSALGLMSGVTVPLLHRGSLPLPSGSALLQMSGSALAGSLIAILIGSGF
jgi:membrane-associated phospholipid phosphatase